MLKADEGKVIQSVAAGQVIYADWIKGLGMLTIINHGDGYMSLYGHAQSYSNKLVTMSAPKRPLRWSERQVGSTFPSLF